ncbi:MAG: 30S ribosomal protein S20 [Candidatus Binatia bacterium]|nr:30S ribosomal protein S20 [Candidatus Binatia bacterium]
MAVHKSAIKRHRESLKRKVRNHDTKSRVRTLVKKVREAVASKDRDTALIQLREVNRALKKAVSKGIIQRNTASRRLSRLSRSVGLLSATQ